MGTRNDPVKSSILRESGMGWTSPPPESGSKPGGLSTTTTPLRIAKRDSPRTTYQHPSQITRRTSNTYKKLGKNNLVSKSPFKSQIPTPSGPPLPAKPTPSSASSSMIPRAPPLAFPSTPTRKVSGEKRPRTLSMHEQAEAENDRQFAYKRERKQSKGYQGLIQKEPVTKSPFRARVAGRSGAESPLPPLPSASHEQEPEEVHQMEEEEEERVQLAQPSARDGSPSPFRSSLVSKRLHGPRLSGSSIEARRQRRKTVTFDEECDVVEFDTESHEDFNEDSDADRFGHEGDEQVEEEGNGSYERDDSMEVDVQDVVRDMEVDERQERQPYHQAPDHEPIQDEPDGAHTEDSFESVPLDGEGADDSLTGMVNYMLGESVSGGLRTPERTPTLASDNEDGIPYGRTHHYERVLEQRARSPPSRIASPVFPIPLSANRNSVRTPSPPNSLPKAARRLTSPSPLSQSPMSPSDIPLGRSTHAERVRAERAVEEEVERGVRGLQGSPSPQKPGRSTNLVGGDKNREESLVPKFDVSFSRSEEDKEKGEDPFAIPSSRDRVSHRVDLSFASQDDGSESSMDYPANLSIGHTEVSLGGLDMELGIRISDEDKPKAEDLTSPAPLPRPSTPESDSSNTSLSSADNDSPSSVEGDMPIAPAAPHPARKVWDAAAVLEVLLVAAVLMDELRELARKRLMDDVAGAEEQAVSMRVEAVTEGVQAGRFDVDDSMRTDNTELTDEEDEDDQPLGMQIGLGRPPIARAVTEPDVFSANSREASGSSNPPPPPPKDAIKTREQLILEKRREARQREEDESRGFYTPPREQDRVIAQARQSRRRSKSTGDMAELAKKAGDVMADHELETRTGDDLGDTIQRELRKLDGKSSTYQIKEQATIYASSNPVTHMQSAGDVNAGKAWRPVRRPSDMNEYSKQIKEARAQEKPGKAHGKVFVRVVGIKGVNVPLPHEATAVTCTLNNGIHYVTTPECRLGRDTRIDQEFELIEHSKLEFTLTMKIRRDPHIITQFKAVAPAPPPPAAAAPSKGGMRAFFSSSPKKAKVSPKVVAPPHLPENLARYLKPDGTLARAFISFKDIASRCDTKLFETNYPLIGQRIEVGGAVSTLQVGELALQVFRLPPLPSVPAEQLPQSLEECLRGLRHNRWHKNTYFEGTLTQQGGDCMTWRRRQLRVIGANLVAFNDVTKKATASIGLKKAIAVEDDQEARADLLSPASALTSRSTRAMDDYDCVGGVERSFRLIFPNDEEIMFFADTDDEKAKWLEVLRALVGHIPPNPLWAELVWQRQEELRKQALDGPSEPSPNPSASHLLPRRDPGILRGPQR
ncbi:hypothetical protein HWV62_36482 [Athelia sp. TMB]|nr:hypothetical protein HWV62_36482 [Athelia sp. TMB]